MGLGTVGSGVVKILKSQAKALERRTGIRLTLRKVCVRSLGKKRIALVPKSLLTRDAYSLIKDPSVDILVELIGGIHPAKEIITQALTAGKHVVTANKALLAEEGSALLRRAQVARRRLGIEASVCGGIPIIKSLTEGLASNEITHFLGIVNGTCNFILTAMSGGSVDFKAALARAQSNGYAEKNPRLDIEGIDSAHKLAILARLAFRTRVPFGAIYVEGIGGVTPADMEYARELGYVVKLLAIGKRLGGPSTSSGHGPLTSRKRAGRLELRVHPTLLPMDHPLANVRGVYNAVFIHADQAGDMLFYGQGAGMMPTASAVISDILDIAKDLSGGQSLRYEGACPRQLKLLPIGDIRTKYYLRFQVQDRPGVLGQIARTLGRNNISILSVHQKESPSLRSTPVVILTYEAEEKNLRRALKEIDSGKRISEKTRVIRVEG